MIEWEACPECGRPYFLATTMNVRNGRFQAIPLESAPADVQGNFRVMADEVQFARDLAMNFIGPYPMAFYARGNYVPHNPSHFTGAEHADEELHRRSISEEPYHGRR